MIIRSLLDTDLYKFTMMQVVLHHFPGAQVEYRFKCRTPGIDLAAHAEEIAREVAQLCRLRFSDAELDYLRAMRFMKSDFVDFLGLFQFNQKYISITPASTPGEIDITIRGPWLHTILYEIPVLAIVSEVYFRRTQPRADLAEGRNRLGAKMALLRSVVPELLIRISDFGTRRRFSLAWHNALMGKLSADVPPGQFIGTSNVYFARKYSLAPIGTMAHEMFMVVSGIMHDTEETIYASHNKVLQDWWDYYGFDLSVALTDTYGSECFFRDLSP